MGTRCAPICPPGTSKNSELYRNPFGYHGADDDSSEDRVHVALPFTFKVDQHRGLFGLRCRS